MLFLKEGKCLLLSVDTRILSQLEILVSALLDSIPAPYTFVVLSSQHNKTLRAPAPETSKNNSFTVARRQALLKLAQRGGKGGEEKQGKRRQ